MADSEPPAKRIRVEEQPLETRLQKLYLCARIFVEKQRLETQEDIEYKFKKQNEDVEKFLLDKPQCKLLFYCKSKMQSSRTMYVYLIIK